MTKQPLSGKGRRRKGGAGERELASEIRDLSGWDVRRRVRQHAGDGDIEGIPGWSAEVKRHVSASRGDIRAWWAQAVSQAGGQVPVLFFRKDRDEWRAVWPVAVQLTLQHGGMWTDYAWTAEGSLAAWVAVARENVA